MDTRKSKEQFTAKQAHALLVVLGGGAGLAIMMQGLLSFALPTEAEMTANTQEEIRSTKIVNSFENISLEARAVYVMELKTGNVLYSKNASEKLPLASITKIMTALVARESMSESAVVTLSKSDLKADGDSGLRPGERWRLEDILNVMLIVSSNDAAHAVAGFVGREGQSVDDDDSDLFRTRFIQMMNEKALALGLDQMQFFNESGLDLNPAQNGGYGSARNVADLLGELWKKYPETIEITAHKDARIYSQDNIAHILPNTNEIIGHIPGLIASKTGFTNLSGGNLAVIFDRGIGDPVIVVVLGSGYKERFDDMQKLVFAAIK